MSKCLIKRVWASNNGMVMFDHFDTLDALCDHAKATLTDDRSAIRAAQLYMLETDNERLFGHYHKKIDSVYIGNDTYQRSYAEMKPLYTHHPNIDLAFESVDLAGTSCGSCVVISNYRKANMEHQIVPYIPELAKGLNIEEAAFVSFLAEITAQPVDELANQHVYVNKNGYVVNVETSWPTPLAEPEE